MAQAARKVEVQVPVVSNRPTVEVGGISAINQSRPLSHKEQERIADSVEQGEDTRGGTVQPIEVQNIYVLLDEAGVPTGDAISERPDDPDQPYVTVRLNQPVSDVLVTASGAPVTDQMNPEHSHYDAGLLERNPIPEKPMPKVGDTIRQTGDAKADAGAYRSEAGSGDFGEAARTKKIEESQAEVRRKEEQRQKDREAAAQSVKNPPNKDSAGKVQ